MWFCCELVIVIVLKVDYIGFYGIGIGNELFGVKNFSGINVIVFGVL